MDKINVQLLLSREEFDYLKSKADSENLSVPLYIKREVLGESEFNKYYKRLLEKVDSLPSGTSFNIKLLMSVEWTKIPKGIKLALGKNFYKSVCGGSITNAKAVTKDQNSVMWYEKI